MEDAGHKQRDTWSKVDVLIKAFGVLFISGALTFYAIYSENRRADTQLRVAQESNKRELYADAMRNRQSRDAAVKADLMGSLLGRVFEQGDPEDRLLALELLARNFQEVDLKPLFYRLDNELEGRGRQVLRTVAYEIRKRQKNQLEVDGAIVLEAHVRLEEEAVLGDGLLIVKLLGVEDEEARLRVSFSGSRSEAPWGETFFNPRQAQEHMLEFSVGPYDFPFVDYFTIGPVRYAFLLFGADSTNAAVEAVVYPRYYFEIQDRIRIDRLLGPLPP